MAAQHDLEIYQGSDFSVQFQLNDAAGQPLDLSSATIASQIRDLGSGLVATFTVVNQPPGFTTLSLSRAVTANLPVGRQKYDVWLRISGVDTPIIEGSAVIRQRVTVLV